MISAAAKLAGVIGYPVTHSLSPRLHGFWLYQHSIDGAYVPLSVEPEKLATVLVALKDMGFRGVNLTLPHKEIALPFMDSLDDAARHIGAVNTVVFEHGKAHGMNTDAYGFIQNLKANIPALQGYKSHALVIGAGGAAKAVCHALKQEGFEKISVTNRSKERLDALKAAMPFIQPLTWEARGMLASVTCLINTTSLGMKGQPVLDISLEKLDTKALVHDIVYNPMETALLKTARERGNPTVDGIGMLLWQAQIGFERWFGVRPEVSSALREHVLRFNQHIIHATR